MSRLSTFFGSHRYHTSFSAYGRRPLRWSKAMTVMTISSPSFYLARSISEMTSLKGDGVGQLVQERVHCNCMLSSLSVELEVPLKLSSSPTLSLT
jgi:hypothetical protein